MNPSEVPRLRIDLNQAARAKAVEFELLLKDRRAVQC
jgi:hypothetical protein